MTYSTALYARVKEYFEANSIKYNEDPDRGHFDYGVNIYSKVRNVHVDVHVGEENLVIVTKPQFGGDPHDSANMQALAEYTLRANYGLIQGNFQLDFRDGEIRYWSSLLTDDSDLPSTTTIGRVTNIGMFMWERYGNGYLQVALAGVDPVTAIKEAEASDN